jgi:alkylation response protein AidB-like acyl-CoA dehydrogenase
MTEPLADQTDDRILDALDDFIESVVVPLEERHAAVLTEPRARFAPTGSYSPEVLALKREVRQASARAGLYTLFAPRALGGGGRGPRLHYLVWERIYHRGGPDRLLPLDTVAHLAGGPSVAFTDASPAIRADVLPALMSGEIVLCWAFSEADAARPLTTIATREDDHWSIRGTKHWVSRSPFADVVLVFAATGDSARREVTAFLLPTDAPGITIAPPTRLFGRAGGEEATVALDGVRADESQIVGRLHDGLDVAASVNDLQTMFTAGRFIGLARWVLDQTARHQPSSGEPSAAHLALVDSVIELRAAHVMALDCAGRMEEGRATPEDLAMVRAFAVESCCRAYDRCMLAFGATSLTSASRIFDGWHQSRIVLLADSGAQSAKAAIARRLLSG